CLELDVPIEVVVPGLMQVVRRERPLGREKLVRRRLTRRVDRLHGRELVLTLVAGRACRDNIVPGRPAAAAARDDMIECQLGGRKFPRAVLTPEAIAEKDVEPREG